MWLQNRNILEGEGFTWGVAIISFNYKKHKDRIIQRLVNWMGKCCNICNLWGQFCVSPEYNHISLTLLSMWIPTLTGLYSQPKNNGLWGRKEYDKDINVACASWSTLIPGLLIYLLLIFQLSVLTSCHFKQYTTTPPVPQDSCKKSLIFLSGLEECRNRRLLL